MRDEHIHGILEGAPLAELGESEMSVVRAHTEHCAECLRAYEAAQLSSLLLRERVAAEVEPTPFFQTRVLAALRERRTESEAPALRRLWRAAGALVSSMAVTVAALAALTFTVPALSSTPESAEVVASTEFDSEEAIFLAQDDAGEDEINYDRVLSTIYDAEGAGGDDGQDR